MLIMIRYILFTILILFPFSTVIASPVVLGVDVDNNSFFIKGSYFGNKSPAAPILWENFDSYATGTNLDDTATWSVARTYKSTTGGSISSDNPYSGIGSAYNREGPGLDDQFNTSYTTFTPTDTIYYSYMARVITTGDPYGQYKVGRATSMSDGSPPEYNGHGTIYFSAGTTNLNDGNGQTETVWVGGQQSATWQRQEMYKVNSTPGVADGEAWWALGNDIKRHETDIITRATGYSFQNDAVILGLMWANARNDGDHRMYIDDVYVDNTQARVELCSGDSWANRGSCDPQIPSSWSSTEITVAINTGAFTTGQTVYLYVVDSNGGVNNNGYPVVIGETQGAIYPLLQPPSSLVIY